MDSSCFMYSPCSIPLFMGQHEFVYSEWNDWSHNSVLLWISKTLRTTLWLAFPVGRNLVIESSDTCFRECSMNTTHYFLRSIFNISPGMLLCFHRFSYPLEYLQYVKFLVYFIMKCRWEVWCIKRLQTAVSNHPQLNHSAPFCFSCFCDLNGCNFKTMLLLL